MPCTVSSTACWPLRVTSTERRAVCATACARSDDWLTVTRICSTVATVCATAASCSAVLAFCCVVVATISAAACATDEAVSRICAVMAARLPAISFRSRPSWRIFPELAVSPCAASSAFRSSRSRRSPAATRRTKRRYWLMAACSAACCCASSSMRCCSRSIMRLKQVATTPISSSAKIRARCARSPSLTRWVTRRRSFSGRVIVRISHRFITSTVTNSTATIAPIRTGAVCESSATVPASELAMAAKCCWRTAS